MVDMHLLKSSSGLSNLGNMKSSTGQDFDNSSITCFVTKFMSTNQDVPTFTNPQNTLKNPCLWTFYVDGLSNVNKVEGMNGLNDAYGSILKQDLKLRF